MKVLIVHRPYAQPSGEERVVETQAAVLQARGVDVETTTGRGLRAESLRRAHVDIVHVHQTFPALLPSAYTAATAARVPVVQHLHNARLACMQPFLVRNGEHCTDCVGRSPLSGVTHGCYRGSVAASAAAAGVLAVQRATRTWRRVARFVAVSDAVAATVKTVVPAERVVVCFNGLAADPAPRDPAHDEGYALFVGRVAPEKGVDLLLAAAAALPGTRFVIAGDGPERDALARSATANVEFLGHVDRARLGDVMARARVLVTPSRGQEPFGLGVIEAAALGVPSIVTRVGGLPEIVRHDETGVVVSPFDAVALADALRTLTQERAQALGAAARRDYELRFTPTAFADRLLAIYDDVLGTYAP